MRDEDRLNRSIHDELTQMSLPEEEATHYQHEYEIGHSIVWVRHNGRHWEAVNILYGSKVHKYFTRVSSQNQQPRALPQSIPGNIVAGTPQAQTVEGKTTDTMPDWQRLLINAGLGDLFERLP